MYSRVLFRKIKHVVSVVVKSTAVDSTTLVPGAIGSVSGIAIGENFSASILARGGVVRASIESAVDPTTDSFRLSTAIPLEAKYAVGVRLLAESTACKIDAIVWAD